MRTTLFIIGLLIAAPHAHANTPLGKVARQLRALHPDVQVDHHAIKMIYNGSGGRYHLDDAPKTSADGKTITRVRLSGTFKGTHSPVIRESTSSQAP